MRRSISFGILVAALILGGLATPAAQSNAQIQQALQIFLQQAHTWTQTQTFNNIVVTGSCTGCGGGGTPGGADTSIQFNDGGAFGGFGTWDGEQLAVSVSADGGTGGIYVTNTANTAGSAAEIGILTLGDTADGYTRLALGVHEGGANFAEFTIAVAGDSGNATPATTFTSPGDVVFSASFAGDENLFLLDNPAAGGTSRFSVSGGEEGVDDVALTFRATADTGVSLTQSSTNGPYPFLFVGASTYTFDAGITFASASLPATTTTFTDGAAAAVGTLTNAPAAGNPTKWIPIDDNGTTRYIPAW